MAYRDILPDMLSQYATIQQLKDLPLQRERERSRERRDQEAHESLMSSRTSMEGSREAQADYMTALMGRIEQQTATAEDAAQMQKAGQETEQLYRRITQPGFTQADLQALCESDPGVEQVCGGGALEDVRNKLHHSFQAISEINARLNPADPTPGSMEHFQNDPEGAATLLEGFNTASAAGKPEPTLNLGDSIYKDGKFIKNPHARKPEKDPKHTGIDAFFQARFGMGPYSDEQILAGQKAFSEARRVPGFWSEFEGGLLPDQSGAPGAPGAAVEDGGVTLNDGTQVPLAWLKEKADREGMSVDEVKAALLSGQQ